MAEMAGQGDSVDRLLLQILAHLMPSRHRCILLIFILTLSPSLLTSAAERAVTPQQSWVVSGISRATVKAGLTHNPLPGIGGIWNATDDGAEIAIINGAAAGLSGLSDMGALIVVLQSPRPGIVAGTVMGWCTPAAKAGYYNCTMFTDCDGTTLSNAKEFTMHLSDASHLSLTEIHNGVEVVAWRAIPFMFRSFLRERRDRQRDLDGLIRQWPPDAGPPASPRYL
jgi:hypothetical protein